MRTGFYQLRHVHLQAIPGSQLAVFQKSGQLPFLEEPDGSKVRLMAW